MTTYGQKGPKEEKGKGKEIMRERELKREEEKRREREREKRKRERGNKKKRKGRDNEREEMVICDSGRAMTSGRKRVEERVGDWRRVYAGNESRKSGRMMREYT